MPYAALLFDLDGTLAETERHGHRVAYNGAFKDLALGWHWSVEEYGKLLSVAGGRERLRHFFNEYPGSAANQPPPQRQWGPLIESIMQRKGELLAQAIGARPGGKAQPAAGRQVEGDDSISAG